MRVKRNNIVAVRVFTGRDLIEKLYSEGWEVEQREYGLLSGVKKLSKGAIQELYNMNRVGYDWLICNKDGRIFFADHGLYPLEKGDKVWNNNDSWKN